MSACTRKTVRNDTWAYVFEDSMQAVRFIIRPEDVPSYTETSIYSLRDVDELLAILRDVRDSILASIQSPSEGGARPPKDS